ncbi:MAG: hypothetical protein ACREC0_06270 [Methylocella sp.]
MKPSSLCFLLVSGTAVMSYVTANFASAQPMPPQPPVGAVGGPPPPPAAAANAAPLYDPRQLPAIKGTVSRYTLTPRGDVDGLILTDGTEVRFPPHLSTQLVYAVKPGDAITVRGLKALSVPVIAAVSITNDASGQSVIDNGPGFGAGPKGPPQPGQMMSVQGRVQTTLHGPRGEVNGAMLDDGTILRLPPPEAERFASLLAPGQAIAVQGDGLVTPMGRVVEVQAIGPSQTQLSWVERPGPPPGKRGPRP